MDGVADLRERGKGSFLGALPMHSVGRFLRFCQCPLVGSGTGQFSSRRDMLLAHQTMLVSFGKPW